MSPTREWLELLYGRSPGWFTVITFRNGRPTTKAFNTAELDKVAKAIERAGQTHDVYVSVATYKTKPMEGRRGSLSDVQSIPGWWADLDIGTEGHKTSSDGKPNPANEKQAMSILDGLPEPSAVIHSGGGLQVWWLFEEPWVFDDPKAAQKASTEWQMRLKKNADAKGYHVDTLGDLPRILRAPGTANHKTDNVRPVVLKKLSDQRYSASELTVIGETDDEILAVMRDMRTHGTDMLTLGQYLQPSNRHHPVVRYVTPEEFTDLGRLGERMGFRAVFAAPLVRSSFHAAELFAGTLAGSREKSHA